MSNVQREGRPAKAGQDRECDAIPESQVISLQKLSNVNIYVFKISCNNN